MVTGKLGRRLAGDFSRSQISSLGQFLPDRKQGILAPQKETKSIGLSYKAC
jgi:hypothetical protein